jgi:hypothetical protein
LKIPGSLRNFLRLELQRCQENGICPTLEEADMTLDVVRKEELASRLCVKEKEIQELYKTFDMLTQVYGPIVPIDYVLAHAHEDGLEILKDF